MYFSIAGMFAPATVAFFTPLRKNRKCGMDFPRNSSRSSCDSATQCNITKQEGS